MPSIILRNLLVLVLSLSASQVMGCEARGRAERVTPHHFAPEAPETVEMFFDNRRPAYPYRTIARLEAEAATRRFVTIAEAEAAANDKLRDLAARYGAHAIIEIEHDVLVDGEPVAEEPDPTERLRDTRHVVRATGTAIRQR